jgi:hypothetical protein
MSDAIKWPGDGFTLEQEAFYRAVANLMLELKERQDPNRDYSLALRDLIRTYDLSRTEIIKSLHEMASISFNMQPIQWMVDKDAPISLDKITVKENIPPRIVDMRSK